jgi:thymidylate synthase
MKEYFEIIESVIKNGKLKNNRTGIDCLTKAGHMFEFDMSSGKFPLLTARKMPVKSMLVELEGFIKGITDKSWYQTRGCKFWDSWANPVEVDKFYKEQLSSSLDLLETPLTYKECQFNEPDLGPIYGYQWRGFGKHYEYNEWTLDHCLKVGNLNGLSGGVDQLKNIVDTLKTNPNDRRMLCSAWNPNHQHMMALPPCHYSWGIVHIDGVINLYWTQRSCDLILGIPNNIASYATLLLLICKETNMKPGNLIGFLADVHIYENHLEGAQKLLTLDNIPELPTFKIQDKDNFNIFEWTHKDYELNNYNPLAKMSFDIAI